MTIELCSDGCDAQPVTELVPSPRKLVNFHQDYDRKRTSMFLGEPMGIVENLQNRYPEVWELYKRLKNLDWSEDEIDISPCFNEFLTEDEEITNLMIDTLAFQMEADSQAANVAQLLYPFINNTELKCYVTELAKNECLTPDHQVLTADGWKQIDQVTVEDKVAQWQNGWIAFVHPTECITLDHDGEIHEYTSETFSQRVTPTHRMVTVKRDDLSAQASYTQSMKLELSEATAFPVSGVGDWDEGTLQLDWLSVNEEDTLLEGDTFHISDDSDIIYVTKSETDAVKVLTLIHLTGDTGSIHNQLTTKGETRYVVSRRAGSSVPTTDVIKTTSQYTGKVYCLKVPSTAFLIKRGNVISVTGNCLHSLAYKFIVESSFEVPTQFLKKVLEIKEAYQRLEVVDRVFQELFVLGNRYNLGMVTDETIIRKAILKAYVTMLGLERIQFVESFSVTFGLADRGISEKSRFVPIAKLVQKIAVDEFQIHVQGNKAVLKNELAIPEIFAIWIQMLPEVTEILMSIVNCEVRWLEERLFKDKPVIAGIEREKVRKFIYYSAQEDVFDFLQIPLPFERILENPLPFMNKWLEIDKTQGSPQEENTANYLLGGFMDDTEEWSAPTA